MALNQDDHKFITDAFKNHTIDFMGQVYDKMDEKNQDLKADIKGDIKELKRDLIQKHADLKQEIKGDISKVEQRIVLETNRSIDETGRVEKRFNFFTAECTRRHEAINEDTRERNGIIVTTTEKVEAIEKSNMTLSKRMWGLFIACLIASVGLAPFMVIGIWNLAKSIFTSPAP